MASQDHHLHLCDTDTENTSLLVGITFAGTMRKLQPIHSFQSRDRLEDLEGKTSIELQHKHVNLSSVSQPHIFRSHLKRIKQRYVNKMQVLAICNPY